MKLKGYSYLTYQRRFILRSG